MFSNSVQSACVLTGGIAVQIQSESHIVNAPAFPPDSLGRGMPFIYATVLQIESTLYPDFFYPIHYFNVNEEKVSGLPMNPATIGLMYIRSLPMFTPVLRFFIADVTMIWYRLFKLYRQFYCDMDFQVAAANLNMLELCDAIS